MTTSQDVLFSQENLKAVLDHLTSGNLSAQIVKALEGVTSEEESRTRIAALVQARLDNERKRLDAETSVA